MLVLIECGSDVAVWILGKAKAWEESGGEAQATSLARDVYFHYRIVLTHIHRALRS